jgi:hypothetical protein
MVMAIAEQTAMPVVTAPRRHGALRIAPPRRPAHTLAKITALVLLTAGGVALAAATLGIGAIMLAAKLGG